MELSVVCVWYLFTVWRTDTHLSAVGNHLPLICPFNLTFILFVLISMSRLLLLLLLLLLVVVVVVVVVFVLFVLSSLVTGLFFPVLLLNQRWSPPLRLQASHCSTFRITCDVPITAVFCSESIECFPGTASKFFLKLLVTIQVATIITGTILRFSFHIRCISVHKLLYFNFFSSSFCTAFLFASIATSVSVYVFSSLFLIIRAGLFAVTSLSVCTAWFHNTVTSPSS